jgi:hypothetical protein
VINTDCEAVLFNTVNQRKKATLLLRQLPTMPSKVQVDENLVFLYRCLVNSDCKTVSSVHLVDLRSEFADHLPSDRLQRGWRCHKPEGSGSTHALQSP